MHGCITALILGDLNFLNLTIIVQVKIDVFNGDADGLCALLQWRQVWPADAVRVTGVKRDNALLHRVQAKEGDEVLVLDVTLDANRTALEALLSANVKVQYFDHHAPGELISHPCLSLTIDESPNVCTSLLVNKALGGQALDWALCGAFGDNLPEVANNLAMASGYREECVARLKALGGLLNYNGYGTHLSDLHFDPADLYVRLSAAGRPETFVAEFPEYGVLAHGYAADMALAAAMQPAERSPTAAVYLLPDAPWARRVVGVWANHLSQGNPHRAHLVVCPDGRGLLTASIRAARTEPTGVAAFCQRFPGGGGRASAGGVNRMDDNLANQVVREFMESF